MEIRKKRKIMEFFKRFGVYIGACVLVLALTITGLVVGLTTRTSSPVIPDQPENDPPVSTDPLVFSLPMTNPDVLKDFSNTELQENVTLGQWEAHLAMDLWSDDGQVFAVLGGKVIDVGYHYKTGYTVTIEHEDGFVSTYGSLGEELLVAKDDIVAAGQKLGAISTSSTEESEDGSHLHFILLQNDKKVDPNNYIEFPKK